MTVKVVPGQAGFFLFFFFFGRCFSFANLSVTPINSDGKMNITHSQEVSAICTRLNCWTVLSKRKKNGIKGIAAISFQSWWISVKSNHCCHFTSCCKSAHLCNHDMWSTSGLFGRIKAVCEELSKRWVSQITCLCSCMEAVDWASFQFTPPVQNYTHEHQEF